MRCLWFVDGVVRFLLVLGGSAEGGRFFGSEIPSAKAALIFWCQKSESRISWTGLSVFRGCHFQVLPNREHVFFMEVILEYSCLLSLS